MKDCSVCFCCKFNNIGLHHTISKGQLNVYISKSMANTGIGIGNDERICILNNVDLAGHIPSNEQIPLCDLKMQSFTSWYCLMKKWSNDYCRLLKGNTYCTH